MAPALQRVGAMQSLITLATDDLSTVHGGYNKELAHETGESWAALGLWPGAIIGGTFGGLGAGAAGGWAGTGVGGIIGAGIGYAAGYGKVMWQTRGQ